MKCQKCAKSAVVHLTEVISDAGGAKRAVEIHLCLGHAAEAGLVAPGSEMLPQVIVPQQTKPTIIKKPEVKSAEAVGGSGAIVPAPAAPGGGLVIARDKAQPPDPSACPLCGLSWNNFKAGGLMGCPHDYEHFSGKLLPLLQRAQEGATEHAGKVPVRRKDVNTDRQVTTLRLRRELQKALDAENYEQAASLRDKLKELEKN